MIEPAQNIVSADVEIKGTITFAQSFICHGKIEGEVQSSGKFTLGKTGTVQGDIKAANASVSGSVNGNITVEDRCELKGEAHLNGDLDARRLSIEEGVLLVGKVRVSPQPRIVEAGAKSDEAGKQATA